MPLEICTECGPLDGLGRHQPMCAYAASIGLPRLAEGEEPVPEPVPEPEAPEAEEPARASEPDPPPATGVRCIGCGRPLKAGEERMRVGVSAIHAECAWVLRYPESNPGQVIAQLEGTVDGLREQIRRLEAK